MRTSHAERGKTSKQLPCWLQGLLKYQVHTFSECLICVVLQCSAVRFTVERLALQLFAKTTSDGDIRFDTACKVLWHCPTCCCEIGVIIQRAAVSGGVMKASLTNCHKLHWALRWDMELYFYVMFELFRREFRLLWCNSVPPVHPSKLHLLSYMSFLLPVN